MARLRCGPSHCLETIYADVVQFCNGNCSVAKIVVPLRKGKEKNMSKALLLYRKI